MNNPLAVELGFLNMATPVMGASGLFGIETAAAMDERCFGADERMKLPAAGTLAGPVPGPGLGPGDPQLGP